ncbi:DNA ligase D [Bacillus sp. NPDC077027]|uniref:DNA ligase D n=1 Tax=Bacillus sp. NPDC077027 TaxID=3390548 RepID=UPI003D086263
MKPMLLTATNQIPDGPDWLYELKYDGFRSILEWDVKQVRLISRTGKLLNDQFPEIIFFCQSHYETIAPFLPLTLDGEIVYLISEQQSDFSKVQQRGRLKRTELIQKQSAQFPCHLVVFDLLQIKGGSLEDVPLIQRKIILKQFFQDAQLPLAVQLNRTERVQIIKASDERSHMQDDMLTYLAEGLVAKKKQSKWVPNSRTKEWLKFKNWLYVSVIITQFDHENGYFHGSVFKDELLLDIVHFKHGLTADEEQTLRTLFQSKGIKISKHVYELPPSICGQIACISFDGTKLREPRFASFLLEADPYDCTFHNMQKSLDPLPEVIEVTHPDKPVIPKLHLNKDDYLLYLRKMSPYMLPFLQERLLTCIRFPHGVGDEYFYQKSCPDYAPSFIQTDNSQDISYIVCNDPKTLLWLGNQLAMEFHIPFQTRDTSCPTEIVFDLDPPSVDAFHLAINAAKRLKTILDGLSLTSFVKTSGGKGLQLYIPLKKNAFTYNETRTFTSVLCQFLCEQAPDLFTLERLKKNRGKRLYLDYLQHDEGKTMIAPYSPRGNEQGLVATPLFWEEINDDLHPSLFTMPSVLERLKQQGDPFRLMRQTANHLEFRQVLQKLKQI